MEVITQALALDRLACRAPAIRSGQRDFGQRRGRGVEDFAEAIAGRVFGRGFDKRCSFTGPDGRQAPRIVIEAKGYGATGSKMTDVLGDIEKIIAVKRPDTTFLFLTDGLTWKQRRSDLRKVMEHQRRGQIARV